MKHTSLLAIGAVAGALILLQSGCTTVNTLEPAQPVAQKQMLSDKVTITDTTLHNRARILGVNYAVGPAGFMKIQFEIQNLTSRPQAITYRVEWFDENAMIINLHTMTAIPRTLEGKETVSITATAPTDKARDFRIKFLESIR